MAKTKTVLVKPYVKIIHAREYKFICGKCDLPTARTVFGGRPKYCINCSPPNEQPPLRIDEVPPSFWGYLSDKSKEKLKGLGELKTDIPTPLHPQEPLQSKILPILQEVYPLALTTNEISRKLFGTANNRNAVFLKRSLASELSGGAKLKLWRRVKQGVYVAVSDGKNIPTQNTAPATTEEKVAIQNGAKA